MQVGGTWISLHNNNNYNDNNTRIITVQLLNDAIFMLCSFSTNCSFYKYLTCSAESLYFFTI